MSSSEHDDSRPEELKYLHRLKRMFEEEGLQSEPSFSWVPGASELSREERFKVMNDALDEVDAWTALSSEERMRQQVVDSYEMLLKASTKCRTNVDDYLDAAQSFREMAQRMSSVACTIDMVMIMLSSFLTKEELLAIRKKRNEDESGLDPLRGNAA